MKMPENLDIPILLLITAVAASTLIVRNGPGWLTGETGGTYWDNPHYCEMHPAGKMHVVGDEPVPCEQILEAREICESDLRQSISISGKMITCQDFFGDGEPASPAH